MVMVFATHQYESAIDIHMCPLYPEAPSNCLPHPIPPGCYLILYWPALLFFKNSLLIRAHCISLQNESMGLKCSKGSFRLIPSNKWKENSNKELEVFSVNHTSGTVWLLFSAYISCTTNLLPSILTTGHPHSFRWSRVQYLNGSGKACWFSTGFFFFPPKIVYVLYLRVFTKRIWS